MGTLKNSIETLYKLIHEEDKLNPEPSTQHASSEEIMVQLRFIEQKKTNIVVRLSELLKEKNVKANCNSQGCNINQILAIGTNSQNDLRDLIPKNEVPHFEISPEELLTATSLNEFRRKVENSLKALKE